MSAYLDMMVGLLDAWERAERLTPCQHCGEERRTGFKHYCVVAFMENESHVEGSRPA